MSRSASLSLLRSASSLLSQRSFRHLPAAASTSARCLAQRRHHSEQSGQQAKGTEKPGKPGEVEESETVKEDGKAGEASTSALAQANEEYLQKLKVKEQEVVDLTGRLRYLQADFLNLQRNAAREKEQTRDYAITRFASDLLETVDVLALALKSVPDTALRPANASPTQPPSPDIEPASTSAPDVVASQPPTKSAIDHLNDLHHGVEMTHRLLLQTLFKYGVKPFDPTGDKFDPNRHEALYQAPIPGKEPGSVLECQKIGYTIKDRTLRAAQVGVVAESS